MLPTRPLNKANGDNGFGDNNQMVIYNDLNGSSFPLNADTHCVPKIKVEDISHQTESSPIHWQSNDCFQTNQFMANNMIYSSLDSRSQPNVYSEMSNNTMSSTCGTSNLVYTDLSNQYNPSASNSYQLLYTPNSMPQQNGCVEGENQQNYTMCEEGQNVCNMSQMSAMTAMTAINTNLNVSAGGESKTDCVQTLTPTVLTALNDSSNLKNIQFMKTIEFLRATDLLNLTLQTAELINKNLEIQKEINNTKQLLSRFVTT